jgi:hypothetical protein
VAAVDFEKEIAYPSEDMADWEKAFFVVQILPDSSGHMAGIVVDNMVLVVGMDSIQNFVVLVEKGKADCDYLLNDSIESPLETRALFAPSIHY